MLEVRLNRRIHPLARRTRTFFALSLSGVAVLLAESGCSSDSGSDKETLDPPRLEVVSFQNADGERFDQDDGIVQVACDPRVTIRLGPSSDGGGLLDNWNFRGPSFRVDPNSPSGNCKSGAQCGFVQVDLINGKGKTLGTLTQAALNLVIDGSEFPLDQVREITVTLIAGFGREPFLVKGAPVTDIWKGRFELSSMCGLGGAGGNAGQGGEPAMGGFGGAGDE